MSVRVSLHVLRLIPRSTEHPANPVDMQATATFIGYFMELSHRQLPTQCCEDQLRHRPTIICCG